MRITPEELVRQALLHRIKSELREDVLDRLEIIVEGTSLDIAIVPRSDGALFQPDLPPLLIIETKRQDIQVLDAPEHERQLTGYLWRTGSRDGVLANCEELWHYHRTGDSHSKVKLSNFAQLLDLIRQRVAESQQQLHEQKQWFVEARGGNYASFRRLVELYGRSADSSIRFIYEERGQLAHITGFLFQVDDEQIRCMPRGQAVHEKLTFSSNTFHRLHSISALRRRIEK